MDIVKQLREQATEIAREGHKGWGNTMLIAAEEIERLQSAQLVVAVDGAGQSNNYGAIIQDIEHQYPVSVPNDTQSFTGRTARG